MLIQTIQTLLVVAVVGGLTISPVALWALSGRCDRIGREAAAPISRALLLSLAAALILLFVFRAATGCCYS